MARFLGPDDYGVVAMVTALVGVGEVFRDFGLANAAIQAKTLSQGQKSNLFWINSGIGLTLCILVISCSTLIANFYDDQRLVLVSMIMSSTFLFNGIVTQFRSDLNRKMKYQRLTMTEVGAQALALILGITLASMGVGYWALVAQQVSQAIILLVVMVIVTPWFPRWPDRTATIRPFLSFGANVVGAQLLNYASRNASTIVIGATLTASAVGLYNRAFQLMLLPLNQLNGPSTRVALPVLSRLDGDRKRYDAFILLGQTVMLHVVSFAFALLGGQALSIVVVALGSKWTSSVPIFQILLIAGFFQTAAYASNWVYLSKGLTGANLRFSLIARPFMIVLIIIGSFWGLYGVVWAFTLSTALTWPFSLWWVSRTSDAPARGLFFNGVRTIIAYGIATAVSFVSTLFVSEHLPILRIAIGLVAIIVTLALLAVVWPRFRRDVRAILGARKLLRSSRSGAAAARNSDSPSTVGRESPLSAPSTSPTPQESE